MEKYVVHCPDIKFSKEVIPVKQQTFETLLKTKKVRQQLGGANCHEEQCSYSPSFCSEHLKYHRRCYQKITYIKHLSKRKLEKHVERPKKSLRLSVGNKQNKKSSTSSLVNDNRNNVGIRRGLFPNFCIICMSFFCMSFLKKQIPTPILTSFAELTMKKAAELRNDESMIAGIANDSLIAKEFKKHQCYRDYTRTVSTNSNSESSFSKERICEKGDYKGVCQIIDKKFLRNQKGISMDTLLEKYGIGLSTKLQYRHLLKNCLIATYAYSLLFISPECHSSQLVISRDCLQLYDLSSTIEFSDEFFIQKAAKITEKA